MNEQETKTGRIVAMLALLSLAGSSVLVLPEAEAAPAVCAICVCSEDPVGQLLDCIGPVGLCSGTQAGVYAAGKTVCVTKPTLTTCPSGSYGAKVNGQGACASVYVCPAPYIGAQVGGLGTCANRPTVTTCTGPTYGAYVQGTGACTALPSLYVCSGGTYGARVNGVGACTPLPTVSTCTGPTYGAYVNGIGSCAPLPSPTCPLGTVGVSPVCVPVPDPCMDQGGSPPGCWLAGCTPVDCLMRILTEEGGILDTGAPQPVPLSHDSGSGAAAPDVFCTGEEANGVDTYCEKRFDYHRIKAIGYFYNQRTNGANHVGVSHGYDGRWWYEDWENGRVNKHCTDSGGTKWVGSFLTGGLSQDNYVGTYGVPDCRTGPPRGAWGGLAYFK